MLLYNPFFYFDCDGLVVGMCEQGFIIKICNDLIGFELFPLFE